MLDHVAGARDARGIAVVIDVFRAFSVARYAIDAGAARVLPAGGDRRGARARARASRARCWPASATRAGCPGFDAGNSPTEIRALDLRGKVLVHTTHAGTQGLVNAAGADEVLTGAFVNISAVSPLHPRPLARRVSLVRMGHEARERCAEDDLYAECLRLLLRGSRRRSARCATGCATRRPRRSSSIRPATGRRATISTTAPTSTASTSCCA